MFKISTLNKISKKGLNLLDDKYIITEKTEDADGILVRSQDMHSMELSSDLRAIARAGAGVNNIPLDKCAEKGIVVFNTPGANANAVKELVIAGLFLASRNIPKALTWAASLSEDVSKTVEKGKSQFAGSEISGKTLGVVGLGAIGRKVAASAAALGMNVAGYDPYRLSSTDHILLLRRYGYNNYLQFHRRIAASMRLHNHPRTCNRQHKGNVQQRTVCNYERFSCSP